MVGNVRGLEVVSRRLEISILAIIFIFSDSYNVYTFIFEMEKE